MASQKKWTKVEDQFLIENYMSLTYKEIAAQLGRTEGAVERRKKRLRLSSKNSCQTNFTEQQLDDIYSSGLTYDELAEKYKVSKDQIRYLFRKNNDAEYANETRKFSKEEDDFLILHHQTKSDFEIANELHRSPISIGKRRRRLGLGRENTKIIYNFPDDHWSEEEERFLVNNISDMTYSEIAQHLGRTVKAVMVKSSRLKIVTDGSKWSDKEDDLLKKYASYPLYQIAFMLDRSPKAIKHRAAHLGLKIGQRNKTELEMKIEKILIDLGADYLDHVILGEDFNFEADYVIGKIVIEAHGDYWHGNPILFPNPNSMQLFAIEKDQIKRDYFESLGYEVYELWESEVSEDIQKVKEFIARLLSNQRESSGQKR